MSASLIDIGIPSPTAQAITPSSSRRGGTSGLDLPFIQTNDDTDWLGFRRIEVDITQSIKDEDEAQNILKSDPGHAAAHTLLGLFSLKRAELSGLERSKSQSLSNDLETARGHFIAALSLPGALGRLPHDDENLQVPQNAEAWYLLARLYIRERVYEEAYETLQQAVYCDGRSTTAWVSVGVLYYQINQPRDSLEALIRAIRLNPYLPEAWFNVFILVRPGQPAYNSLHPIANTEQVRTRQQSTRRFTCCYYELLQSITNTSFE